MKYDSDKLHGCMPGFEAHVRLSALARRPLPSCSTVEKYLDGAG